MNDCKHVLDSAILHSYFIQLWVGYLKATLSRFIMHWGSWFTNLILEVWGMDITIICYFVQIIVSVRGLLKTRKHWIKIVHACNLQWNKLIVTIIYPPARIKTGSYSGKEIQPRHVCICNHGTSDVLFHQQFDRIIIWLHFSVAAVFLVELLWGFQIRFRKSMYFLTHKPPYSTFSLTQDYLGITIILQASGWALQNSVSYLWWASSSCFQEESLCSAIALPPSHVFHSLNCLSFLMTFAQPSITIETLPSHGRGSRLDGEGTLFTLTHHETSIFGFLSLDIT